MAASALQMIKDIKREPLEDSYVLRDGLTSTSKNVTYGDVNVNQRPIRTYSRYRVPTSLEQTPGLRLDSVVEIEEPRKLEIEEPCKLEIEEPRRMEIKEPRKIVAEKPLKIEEPHEIEIKQEPEECCDNDSDDQGWVWSNLECVLGDENAETRAGAEGATETKPSSVKNSASQIFVRKRRTGFKCKSCGRDFPTRSQYEQHVDEHVVGSKFKCQFCNITCPSNRDRNVHMKKYHKRNIRRKQRLKEITGEPIPETFNKPLSIKRDYSRIKKPTNPEQIPAGHLHSVIEIEEPPEINLKKQSKGTESCNASQHHDDFTLLTELQSILKAKELKVAAAKERHKNAVERESEATKSFAEKRSPTSFIGRRKTGFKCDICAKFFPTKNQYEKHLEEHCTKNIRCQYCGENVLGKLALSAHMRKHESLVIEVRDSLPEKECDVTLGKDHNYSIHKKRKSAERSRRTRVATSSNGNQDTSQADQSSGEETVPKFSSYKRQTGFRCKDCNKYFATRRHYEYHLDEHNSRTFNCQVCGRSFQTEKGLVKHNRWHALEESQLDESQRKSMKEKRASMISRKLRKQFPELHRCDICSKGFLSRNGLINHRSKHFITNRRCTACSLILDSAEKLREHRAKNSCLKRFSCAGCGYKFARMHSMLQHENACPLRRSLPFPVPARPDILLSTSESVWEYPSEPGMRVCRTYSRKNNFIVESSAILKQNVA